MRFPDVQDHSLWMQCALLEAQKALEKNEVPVGAVIVYQNRIIGRGHNLVESLKDATAHAEMLAITAAAITLSSWRLENAVMYSTLEPCSMCTGAMLLSRINTVVFGANDPRYGACGSVLQIADNEKLDVRMNIVNGIRAQECSELIKYFFQKIRKQEK